MESITIKTVCSKCGNVVVRSVLGITREQALKNAELVKAGFEECAMCFDLAREAEINKKLADARKNGAGTTPSSNCQRVEETD